MNQEPSLRTNSNPSASEPPGGELLTTKELARELKVTERTVQNLVSRGTIRKIQIGRCVRFRLSEVIADLKNQE